MSYAYIKVDDVFPTISMNLFNAFLLDLHASYSAIMDLLVLYLRTQFWHLNFGDSHISLLYQEKQELLQIHYILYLGNNQRLTRYINMSITPPKSLMTAVGVKNKPSAIIFRLSSMLMNITNTYSAIWNEQKAVWSQWMEKMQVSVFPWSCGLRFSRGTCKVGACMTLRKGDSNIMEMQEQMVTMIMTQSR